MPLIYRCEKGAPLTCDEMDGNFKELMTRIIALEQTPLVGEGIGQIDKKGDMLEITGTMGSKLGQFKLPFFTYNIRGIWEAQTAYATFDVVTYHRASWVCIIPHLSHEKFEQNNWKLLLDASHTSHLNSYNLETLPEGEQGDLVLLKEVERTDMLYNDGEHWRIVESQILPVQEDTDE